MEQQKHQLNHLLNPQLNLQLNPQLMIVINPNGLVTAIVMMVTTMRHVTGMVVIAAAAMMDFSLSLL